MSAPLNRPQKFAGMCTTAAFDVEPASPPFEPPHAAVKTAAAAAIVVFAFIAYEYAGRCQKSANCSPAQVASTMPSTPVPCTTDATQSMNFASETIGTPSS